VRTVFVVLNEVFGQDLLEMASTEDEESVEALSPGRAHESLGERIRTRGSNRDLDDADALRAEHLVEACGELRVSIPMRNLAVRAPSTSTKDTLRACWVTHSPTGLAVTPET
jgi:hypothetical protein